MEKLKAPSPELDHIDEHRFSSVEWVLLTTATLAFAAMVAMLAYSFAA